MLIVERTIIIIYFFKHYSKFVVLVFYAVMEAIHAKSASSVFKADSRYLNNPGDCLGSESHGYFILMRIGSCNWLMGCAHKVWILCVIGVGNKC